MELIRQFILSFISTVGFSILYSSPRETLPYAGFVGASGWTVFYISSNILNSNIGGTFLAALTVGLLGEVFARLNKNPATLYITPGIIPLVPGAGMYYTMFALVEKDFPLAADKGTANFFVAASIAIGIIFSSIFSQSITRVRQTD